jgi:catechol 2,3-dioxygenase-like lactoylglutathione lyase family enzyme/extradiol dioxygenase family protein
MRIVIAGLFVASVLATGTASAQYAPFNEAGITMGHWHFASKDLEANKKIFVEMGGLPVAGNAQSLLFPGMRINLTLGNAPGNGGSQGSVVNHVGFIVNNVQERIAQWKAAGVPVLPGNNNRLDQAFVETPDGVRIEILEDKTQSVPIKHEHIHLFVPEAEIFKAQAWYAKTFGGKAGMRNNAPIVDIPGAQIRFAKADAKQAPTKGRVLDHFGVDVKDHAAFVRRIESEGIRLDEPSRNNEDTGTYITDPWGARIEIVQRGPQQASR